MAALPRFLLPTAARPVEQAGPQYRRVETLWLALQILEPAPDTAALESVAAWAGSLTSMVVLRPGEGLLLEVGGSLKYFSGLAAIRQQLTKELGQRGWMHRLASAPTPLAAAWLVRCGSVDITGPEKLAGAIGRLPLTATAWPESVQQMLGQMGLRSIADCLRLPRAGFARRIGRGWLEELDRALGRVPDLRSGYQAPETLGRMVEFSSETSDQALFAEALRDMLGSLEQELRQRQAQIESLTLSFRHLRCDATLTRIRFVEPVHERARTFPPLLARIERIALAEPAVMLSIETSVLLPFRVDSPCLLSSLPGDPPGAGDAAGLEFALVERLRGRFGARNVYGIDAVAEHRPEYAWRRRAGGPGAGTVAGPACFWRDRPLWLLPTPKKRGQSPFSLQQQRGWPDHDPGLSGTRRKSVPAARQRPSLAADGPGQTRIALAPRTTQRDPDCQRAKKGSDPFFCERIESGWWDGQEIRRDYHVVIGSAGEKLWLFRDRLTHEWYLHGIFG